MNEDNHKIYFDPVHSEDVLDTSLECIFRTQNIKIQVHFKAKHVKIIKLTYHKFQIFQSWAETKYMKLSPKEFFFFITF